MNSPILDYNIRFNLRKKLWFSAIVLLAFLFAMPINAGMTFQSFFATWRSEPVAAQKISQEIAKLFSAGDNFNTILIFCIAAFAAGLIFFTWMHSRHKVDLYHSLPCSRARLLMGNYLAGAISVLAPYLINLIFTLIVVAAMGLFPVLNIPTMLAGVGLNILLFLLIYTITVIAVILSGNGVVSGILAIVFLSFGPAVINSYRWLRAEMQPTWFSTTDWVALTSHSSPVARYTTLFFNGDRYAIGWLEAVIMLLLTALLIWLAIRLYQARPSEAAGKALAFPKSRAFIKYPLVVLSSAMAGMFLHSMGDIQNNSWLWFFIGAFLGGVIASQLMEIVYHADFRAVTKRVAPLGITMVLFMGICALFVADVGGYNTYLPKSEEVAKVELLLDGFNSYTSTNYVSAGYYEYSSAGYLEENPGEYADLSKSVTIDSRIRLGQIESPSGIAAAISIAEKCINNNSNTADNSYYWENNYYAYPQTTSVFIRYLLKDGRVVTRQYFPQEILASDIADEMEVIYNDPVYRQNVYQLFSFAPEQIRFAGAIAFEAEHIQQYDNSLTNDNLDKDCNELLQVYRQELQALNGTAMREELPIGSITFQVYNADPGQISKHTHRDSYISLTYPIYASFTHTIELLTDFGIEPQYWQPDLDSITEIKVSEHREQGFNQNNNQSPNSGPAVNNSPYLGNRPAEITIENGFVSFNNQLIKTEETVTYYYPEGKDRETIYRGAEDIAELIQNSYSEYAFLYNSFIPQETNSFLNVCYINSYGGESVTVRYFCK